LAQSGPVRAGEEPDVMTQEQGPLQGVDKWEAERLRATAFILPGADVSGMPSWWAKAVGEEPDEVLTRPRAGQMQQVGAFEGKRLALVAQPGRVDWNLLATMGTPDESVAGLLTLGPFSATLGPFLNVVRRWLGVCPPVRRLAFGSVLVRPVADLQTGYTELSQFLPKFVLDQTDSSDFLYQINRPRMSTSGIELKLNRLTKWSVMQAGFIEVAVGGAVGASLASGPLQFACRLELDISTAAESTGEIPKDKIRSVFEELVGLGCEIAVQGDIP